MKIADYISDHTSENMIFCSVSINHEYMVMMGDENFYHFLGKMVGVCILDAIHPELRDEFCQVCGELKEA